MATTPEDIPQANKKRKTKDLPEGLAYLTEANFSSNVIARLETNNTEMDGEVMVAFEVKLEEGGDSATFELNNLTLDHLRKLCKNVGVKYVNKCTKFQCRKALWVLAEYQQGRESGALTTTSDKTTNNIIRITNIIFSHEFLDSFLALNDIKTRADHERRNLPKDFWIDVAEAMNGSEDDDDIALGIIIPPEDSHFEEINSLELWDFDIMTADAIKKKVVLLMKVRKVMQQNMTVSGEHDSDPYNFVEVAMKKIGKSGLTLLGCYYFFKLCDKNPEVDVSHSIQMDDILKGNTDDDNNIDGSLKNKNDNQKKRAYAAMAEIADVTKNISVEMKETNRLAQQSVDAVKETNRLAQESVDAVKQKNQLAKQSQIIAIAQHLGKDAMLEDLLASLSSSSG
jgi:hypothetical protein